ncbi:hypothetical protein GDO78_003956 [Eleutherodactylus coqui]|uniref:Uncharacterized protein n=1 Tax=Eleutherodactylus coqui TaxID=57060 RepID=A0A8J6K1Y9_ELECQ|nr:hypothetical protein GDO78_003956 [Eleutherodactylus coqui]
MVGSKPRNVVTFPSWISHLLPILSWYIFTVTPLSRQMDSLLHTFSLLYHQSARMIFCPNQLQNCDSFSGQQMAPWKLSPHRYISPMDYCNTAM